MVEISEPNRTKDQNACQWPILAEFARQKQWPVNGQLCWMTAEEWKDILTAAFRNESSQAGARDRWWCCQCWAADKQIFEKKEFSDWIEYLHYCAGKI